MCKNKIKNTFNKTYNRYCMLYQFERIKKKIIDCINFKNKHICHFVKCYKMYNLSTMEKHKCNVLTTSDIINYSKKSKINSNLSIILSKYVILYSLILLAKQ